MLWHSVGSALSGIIHTVMAISRCATQRLLKTGLPMIVFLEHEDIDKLAARLTFSSQRRHYHATQPAHIQDLDAQHRKDLVQPALQGHACSCPGVFAADGLEAVQGCWGQMSMCYVTFFWCTLHHLPLWHVVEGRPGSCHQALQPDIDFQTACQAGTFPSCLHNTPTLRMHARCHMSERWHAASLRQHSSGVARATQSIASLR